MQDEFHVSMRSRPRPFRGRLTPTVVMAFLVFLIAPVNSVQAQGLMDILTAPKTLIDRAIEARSVGDIAKDNKIVLKVNAIMADLGTIKASTEIYEQRLLVTGIFDDRKLYDRFRSAVRKVEGVKKLYWHVVYMSKRDQKKQASKLLGWADALALDAKVGVKLVATKDVADVNFRVAVDSFATVYLLGRARSKEEARKAVDVASSTEGVKKLKNYVSVRP